MTMSGQSVIRAGSGTGQGNKKLDNTVFELLKNKGVFPGSIVLSKAGHDINRMYIVISVENKMALLVDGIHRNRSCPKKKRVTHVKMIGILGDYENRIGQLELTETESDQNRLIQEWLLEILTKQQKKQVQQEEEEP